MAPDHVRGPLRARAERFARAVGIRRAHLDEGSRVARFLVVGGLGYAVNLDSFAVMVHAMSVDFRVAGVGANVLGFANKFALNRAWTWPSSIPRSARSCSRRSRGSPADPRTSSSRCSTCWRPVALWLVGVRDRRVLGLVMASAPVVYGWHIANVTLVLAAGLAALGRCVSGRWPPVCSGPSSYR